MREFHKGVENKAMRIIAYHHSLQPMRMAMTLSSPATSSSSKPSKRVQSRSSTPTQHVTPSRLMSMGITNSLLVSASQAIWPGKASTSLTNWADRLTKAVAQTEADLSETLWVWGLRAVTGGRTIDWQAGFPWNGPSRSFWVKNGSIGGDGLVFFLDIGWGNRCGSR